MNALTAYGASLCTIFVLYPYRDYVKLATRDNFNKIDLWQHSVWRYKGILAQYQQPLLLAAPWGLLYGGWTAAGGGAGGAVLGGFLFGHMKAVINTISYRMNGTRNNYNRIGEHRFASIRECLKVSTRHYGPISFLCGGTAHSLIAMCWHGAALTALGRRESSHSSFGYNFVDAFRLHAGLTLLTNPLRNALRSGMHQRDRPGGVKSVKALLHCEQQIYQEGISVFKAALRSQGISFFLEGALRTTFKTSVPFGVTYALFRALGGSLSGRSGEAEHHGHYHHPRIRPRHF